MLEGEGKVHLRVGKKHGGGRIYIPSNVTKDSQFPFDHGEEVAVKIDDGKIIVQREEFETEG